MRINFIEQVPYPYINGDCFTMSLRTNRIVPRDGLVSGTGNEVIQVRNTTFTDIETISCDSSYEDTI